MPPRAFALFFSLGLLAQAQNVDSYARLRELFPAPPAAYSTMPFFVWNGEVTERVIDKFLDDFHAQGVRGFFIHPRPGMITPYLSERWFALVRYTVDKAKKLGMEAWLYDENSYPSGFAGGHVPAGMPESYNLGQGLALRKLEKPGTPAKCEVLLQHEGKGYCFERVYHEKRAWHGGFSYVDLLLPGVTEKFIEVTMPGYERTLGADFGLGKTVPGIFTDEPHIAPPGRNAMRWTPDLFPQFEKRFGYDLKPRLISLFEDTGDWRKVRHDYHALLLDLFIERWSKPWYRFAEKKGIAWTGHYWEHAWPNHSHGPDNMAMYAWHHVPAIDMLFNQFREDVNAQFGNVRAVKELASVANQMGRRRTLSETYGGAGWELRFEDMKRLGDWEYALGVNFMNQHLTYTTMAGARKYDYPQTFDYHEPWWRHYRVLADYYARLSLALSSGEQVNEVLVVEPTTSTWLYSVAGKNDERAMKAGAAFQAFITNLEALQVEYDLGSENIVRDHGKVEGGRFVVGRRGYTSVVLPPGTENLESATVNLLAAYLKAGGRVVSLVDPPAYVDGAPSDRLRRLAADHAKQWTREAPANPDFSGVSGKLFHQRRRLSDGELLLAVNSSLEAPARATVRLSGRYVTRLDPFTGKTEAYPSRGGSVSFELPPAGSLLLVGSNTGTSAAAMPPAAPARPAVPSGPATVRRLAPNAIRIDYCDLKIKGDTQAELYFYDAQEKVFQAHGFSGNPWNTAVQYKTDILDRNKFAANSGFEAAFHFELDAAADRKGLRAVIERPALWRVAVNGRPVKARPGEWWLDVDFGVYEIGALARTGRNTITLAAKPMSVHHELEPVIVLGDFGVAAQEKGWKLIAAGDLGLGAWKDQRLPFYSDRVAYARTYNLRNAGRYKVRLGKWHGTVAEVTVNGKSAGIIGWQPYELDITDLVGDGSNRVEVVVYGSLKNLYGPHHGKINRGLTAPPSFRTGPATMPGGAAYDLESYGLFEDFMVLQQPR
ncbi:MAG: glycosyl hydrolase [Bryobacteraceae bacterium]